MSTTLLAEWNVSNAVRQETPTRNEIIQAKKTRDAARFSLLVTMGC